MEKEVVPISKVVRERLSNTRYAMGRMRSPYSTAKNMDGAKSSGRAVPPMGAGKLTMMGTRTENKENAALLLGDKLLSIAERVG